MNPNTERRLLQIAVAIACIVPLAAGGYGAVAGTALVGKAPAAPDLDSHFRYLSGLLLGIGIAFAWTIPAVERRSRLFATLSAIVVTGGLARLLGMVLNGAPGTAHSLALGMELGVVPLLLLWQRRIARLSARPPA